MSSVRSTSIAARGMRGSSRWIGGVQRPIVSFHRDGDDDWVAGLERGHRQHVGHRVIKAGATQDIAPGALHRLEQIGPVTLAIELFRITAAADGAPPGHEAFADEGGNPVCWANLVCPECGAVVAPDPHREGWRADQSL